MAWGICSLQDEYGINRARVVGQLMEAGKRMEGRKQKGWVYRMLMKEVEETEIRK